MLPNQRRYAQHTCTHARALESKEDEKDAPWPYRSSRTAWSATSLTSCAIAAVSFFARSIVNVLLVLAASFFAAAAALFSGTESSAGAAAAGAGGGVGLAAAGGGGPQDVLPFWWHGCRGAAL